MDCIKKNQVAVIKCTSYDKTQVFQAICKAIDLLGGIETVIQGYKEVCIKPNLCLPEKPEKAITTHPEIVDAIVKVCKVKTNNIVIGDSPVGKANSNRCKQLWNITGMYDVAQNNGCKIDYMNGSNVFKEFLYDSTSIKYLINNVVDKPVCLINVPKFKTHGLMLLTGAVKNLYGLIPDSTKKWLHRQFPNRKDFAMLLIDIYEKVMPALNIVDAVVSLEGEGPGAKGKPKDIGLILASRSGIAIDFLLADLMGIDPLMVPTNKAWIEKNGEKPSIEILGDDIEPYIRKDYILPQMKRYDNLAVVKKIFALKYSKPRIVYEKCISCGLCMDNCSVGAIFCKDNHPTICADKCIECLICHEICPKGAVEISNNRFYDQLSKM